MREELESALLALARAMHDTPDDEGAFQKLFEKHPVVLRTLGYGKFHAKLRLPTSGLNYLEPDFIGERGDGLFDIIDLKTPDAKIVKPTKSREDFYAPLNEYLAQICVYSEYFDDGANRELIFQKFGTSVHKSPNTVLIAGRSQGLDRVKLHEILNRRSGRITILTFDDVYDNLFQSHVAAYSSAESLNGVSLHLVLKLNSLDKPQDQYVCDCGLALDRNRVSLFITPTKELCFRVIDTNGHYSQTSVSAEFVVDTIGKFIYLVCEFGSSDSRTMLQIFLNGDCLAREESCSRSRLASQIDLNAIVVGTDLTQQFFCAHSLSELLVFRSTLSLADRLGCIDFFRTKWNLPY